jgi:predicted MPP superfamily phosphohydrolase
MTVYGYANLHTVQMTSYTVRTDKDVRATGYRVALIADVHFGVSLDEAALLEKCAEIAAQAPDLVVLCGDIVDHSATREGMQSVFRALGAIESTYGVYYVYGNHDRPSRMMQGPFSAEELNAAIEESGITILQDECVQITDDLVLVGREDRSKGRGDTPRASIEALLADVERTDFILTLDHQPNEYAENTAAGTDLLLSGHTHGGQLFPLDILQEIVPFNDAVYGEYALGKDGIAIVTSGFGTWEIPIKTAAPAEYVIIDILPE